MANRLDDYGFRDASGQILDTPDRIAAFLTDWVEKNPGYKYVTSPGGTAFVGTPSSMKAPAQRMPGGGAPVAGRSGADSFAEYFFAGIPDLYRNPAAIKQAFAANPEMGKAAQEYINNTAAVERAKDKGNIFGKAFNNISTFVSAATGLNALTAGLGALTAGAGLPGAFKAGTTATQALASNLKNSFFPNGLNVFATDPLRGNSVPGIRTGVTTPAGGGAIVGTGQAAPITGMVGGAPLGASALAVKGGAQAANIFPRFPELGQVQPLPSGVIPGTNTRVGEAPTKPSGPGLGDLKDAAELAVDLFGGGGGAVGGNAGPLAFEGSAFSSMPSGGTGSGGPLNMLSELSRAAGDASRLGGNTKAGSYFNVLQHLQPRYAAGYT